MTLLYLSREAVRQAVAGIDPVAIMRRMLELHASDDVVLPAETYLRWHPPDGGWARSLCLPGYLGGEFQAAGVKVINANPVNPVRALARADGVVLLFDRQTARIVCVMEGAFLSALRTAAISSLAAEILMVAEADCLAVIGCGALAGAHLDLLPARMPKLHRVLLFDTVASRATALAAEAARTLSPAGVGVAVADSAEDAVRPASVVILVTTTDAGYVRWSWLRPGSLVVNVSLDDVLDEVVFRADYVVVDDWELIRTDPHRQMGRLYRAGRVDFRPAHDSDQRHQSSAGLRWIDATLGELVIGARSGRQRDDDVILVNPFGMALADVALAHDVYRQALLAGLGAELER